MATQKRSSSGKRTTTGKKTTAGGRRTAAPKKRPIRREVGGVVCLVLALCIALGALSLPVSARADAASFVQVSLAGANAYDSANAATILQAGTVLMLQNPVKAAYNGQEYYYV